MNQLPARTLGDVRHDFNQQCLRILRCTAHAMASSPGGLRYQAGTRPWLDGLAIPNSLGLAMSMPHGGY
ncbi:MAG: hypothetical protein H7Z77_01555 [Chitinophagaceae bacterium]|nr:hypothetical protein [Polaromonas sp.]